MRYKMQSLDSYSGTVGLNYHLQHIMYKCPGSPGTCLVLNFRPFKLSQLTLLTWKMEMSSNDLALLTFLRRPCYFAS